MSIKLRSKPADLEALYAAANGRGKSATVNREALMNVLIDRENMRQTFGPRELEEPQ